MTAVFTDEREADCRCIYRQTVRWKASTQDKGLDFQMKVETENEVGVIFTDEREPEWEQIVDLVFR